jgi:hypothetical protein
VFFINKDFIFWVCIFINIIILKKKCRKYNLIKLTKNLIVTLIVNKYSEEQKVDTIKDAIKSVIKRSMVADGKQ